MQLTSGCDEQQLRLRTSLVSPGAKGPVSCPTQEAALAALPPKLREAADTADMTPFPLERMVPTHTPPIKGFGDSGRSRKTGGQQ